MLFSSFAVIAGLEIGLRFYARYDVSARPWSAASLGKIGCEAVFVHDRILGWRLAENCTSVQAQHRGWEYAVTTHSNNHGFRDVKNYETAKRAGVRRLVLVGDSFSFGNGVEELARTSNLLEALFKKQTEVYNLAISNYGLDQAYLMLRERGFSYHPDVILIGFSNPMFDRLTRGVTASGWSKPFFKVVNGKLQLNDQPDESILAPKSLLDHSYLWEFIRMRIAALPPNKTARDNLSIELTEKILADIANESKSRGVRLVVFSINTKGILDRTAEGTPELNRLIDRLAKRYSFDFLDLYASFRTADYARFFYPIDGHYNVEGHIHVAQELCAGLRRLGLVDIRDNPSCRLDRAKIYAAIDAVRHCDFDGSGNGLALGSQCLPQQCAPLGSSEVCQLPSGQTGQRRCEGYRGWGTRWTNCAH